MVGEIAADIIGKQLYGKEVKDLTEEEKQTINALSQLASGLAVAAGGGNIGDASAAISSSKNAVENNYLNSDEHQTKKGLEYKERKGILTDEEKMELLELRLKDDSLSDALINACIDVNSDECHVERQKAYDALKTYKYLTYLNPPNAQIGYQEIEHLLNSTSSEANKFRAIYNGYVVSFKSFGYSDEEAQVMAGRTIAIMMMINGLEGHFALPIINRALKGSKLSTANESKTSNITGKLDKDYFESVYGKENVQQGGGNYKETKDNINNNHAANQQANKSSNFDEHVVNEKGLGNAGKGTTNYKVQDLSKVQDTALDLNNIRQATQDYLKSSYQDKAVSYATASVTVNGKTEYFLSVSGKAWSGNAPTTVNIGGVNYKVVVNDSKSIPSVSTSTTQTNYNHAEQKLFSYIQDTYKGQNADINVAVQNTSKYEPGMCVGCGSTSQSFAEANKNFNINIFQGTTGKNP